MKASELINALRRTIGDRHIPPLAKIRWCLIEAVNANMVTVSYDACMEAVKQGLSAAKTNGIHLFDVPLCQTGAYASLIEGDYAESEQFIERMLPVIKPYSYFDVGNCSSIRLGIDLVKHNYFNALRHALQTMTMAFKTSSPIPIYLTHVGIAQSLLNIGSFKMAAEQIKRAKRIAKDIENFNFIYLALITEAYMYVKKGDMGAADALKKAMTIGSQQQYFNFLHWNPDMMSILCARALELGIEVDYVKDLIKRRNLLPPTSLDLSSQPHCDNEKMTWVVDLWPYPIKIYTLGRLRILKDGEPLPLEGKAQKKPLEMLKALIAFGGSYVSVDMITDSLWPDADGDLARRSFDVTLHRLRQLIGNNNVIQFSKGLITLDPRYCSVDVWSFQLIAGMLDKLYKKPESMLRTMEIILLSEKAINIYRGNFLSEEDVYQWALSAKERLRSKFIRVIKTAGRCLEDSGQYEKSAEYYERAIETDNLDEELYRRLMLCFQKLGNNAKAVSVYNRCRDVLSVNLGIEPSEKTEEIYRAIKKSR